MEALQVNWENVRCRLRIYFTYGEQHEKYDKRKRSKNSIQYRKQEKDEGLAFMLPKISKHQMAGQYQGSDNRGEIDIESDVNLPASGKLRQSTTVSSQC